MRPGDLLVTYVSKAAAFSDLREALSSAPKRADRDLGYDRELEWLIETKPLVALERDQWVDLHVLVDQLRFTSGKRNLGLLFLTSLRQISSEDGEIIVSAIRTAGRKSEVGSEGGSTV